jgi:hypothetical protein
MLSAEPNATTSTSEDITPPAHRLTPEQMTVTRRCLALLGVLSTGSMIGVSFSLYLVGHYPLLLVALSPLGRHVVLAAPVTNPAALIIVTAVRRMAFYLSCFYLGRALGPAGIPWIEKRAARFAVMVRWVESLFSRAPRLVVLLMVGPTVSALAGVSGMSTRTYSSLAIASLIVRLIAIVALAEWLREYLEIALAWIDEYWLPGTVLMVAGVALYTWRRKPGAALTND